MPGPTPAMDPGFPPHPFWDFSLAVYRGPVPAACLALQDRHGLDVNLLLYILWRGQRTGRAAEAGALAGLLEAVAAWQRSVVVPLRSARRAARVVPDGLEADLVQRLHSAILGAELAAEHAEQLLLAVAGQRWLGSDAPVDALAPERALAAATADLSAYFRIAGVRMGGADREPLAVLLAVVDRAGGSAAAATLVAPSSP